MTDKFIFRGEKNLVLLVRLLQWKNKKIALHFLVIKKQQI